MRRTVRGNSQKENTMRAMLCLGVLAMFIGCDASKSELDSTKTSLSEVTKQRDDLKAQVATLQQQLVTAQGDLAKEKASETAASEKSGKSTVASKSAAGDSGATAKNKHAHKS